MCGRFAIVTTMVVVCLASGTGSNGVASFLARSEFAPRGSSKPRTDLALRSTEKAHCCTKIAELAPRPRGAQAGGG